MMSTPEIQQEFFDAVKLGDTVRVAALLNSEPALINARSEGATALHFAAIENQQMVVDELIGRGADLNALDDEFTMTPTRWANERGHMAMVAYLLQRGADVDLIAAVAFGLKERVQRFLEDDSSKINESNHYGTPIHEASLWGHVDILNLLLERGADPTAKNIHGETALQIAQKQVESNCTATPIVIDSRRAEIAADCRAVVERLSSAS